MSNYRKTPIFKTFLTALVIALVAITALLPVEVVRAEGIVGQLTASSSTVAVGNTVSLTFLTAPAVTIMSYDVTVNFDTSKFEYVSGSDLTNLDGGHIIENNGSSIRVLAYGVDIPNQSKLCKLTFKAKAEGTAAFTTASVIVNDESPVASTVSVTVGAAGETTATTKPTTEASTAAQTATLDFAEGTFTVIAIPKSFPTPTGFYRTAITIGGVRMEAFKATQGDLILIYLDSDTTGTNLYFYDSNGNSIYPFEPFTLPGHDFILIRPDASAIVPDGFSSTSLTLNDQQINCWKKDGSDNSSDPYYETYLLYLLDSEGQKGFYLYKPNRQMIFPYLILEPVSNQAEESETQVSDQPVSSQTEPATGIFAAVQSSGFNLWMIGTGLFALLSLLLLIFLVWTYFEYVRPLEKQSVPPNKTSFNPPASRPIRPTRIEPTRAEPPRAEPPRAEPPDDNKRPPNPPSPPNIRRID